MNEIVMGCPVRNRAWVLPEYLAALSAIDYPEKSCLFLVNACQDTSPELVYTYLRTHKGLAVEYNRPHPPGHRRGEYNRDGYRYLAGLRNAFLELFLAQTDGEYLLSIDSDIIAPTDIIAKLLPLADHATIVAAAISNVAGRSLGGGVPGNFMLYDGQSAHHLASYPASGVLAVDITGAACLIPRAILMKGVRYAPHPQGEDIPFCLAAQQQGCRLLVSFDVNCEHRMVAVEP